MTTFPQDEIHYEPESGWGWFVLLCGAWSAIGFVMYSEGLLVPLSGWGDWIGAGLTIVFFVATFYGLCLIVVFNPRRFSFTEQGMGVWSWRGPQFVLWNSVTRASLGMFRVGKHGGGWISLCVLIGADRKTFDIPIQLYKKRGTLLGDLNRWIPVPIHGLQKYQEQLVNDNEKWKRERP